MFKIVSFPSQGVMLRGKLYLPPTKGQLLPIVIMAHGFSATINGMVGDRYAEVFLNEGFAVLLYDHYSFGISDGEPRRQINKWVQARGYCDAIDFVTDLPEIDNNRIAIWGDSASGGEVISVGAIDKRVKAVVAQVPACGQILPPDDNNGKLFNTIQETLMQNNLWEVPRTILGPMPVVSFDQAGTPSLLEPITAFHWFIEYGARYGTNWENQATLVSLETGVPFHPGLCAPHLKVPLLMVIAENDEMPGAESEISRAVYDSVPQPKKVVELEGGHFGLLYYPSDLFNKASRIQSEFLVEYL